MKKIHDLSGRTFGRLTVYHEAPRENYHRRWVCVCRCGRRVIAFQTNLLSGRTKSCGCAKLAVDRIRHLLQQQPQR